MPGWPVQERVAMILRAHDASKLFLGIDLSMLPADVQPWKVIQFKDLAALNLSLPWSMCPPAAANAPPPLPGNPDVPARTDRRSKLCWWHQIRSRSLWQPGGDFAIQRYDAISQRQAFAAIQSTSD
ncbi:MAG: hypothetical protein HC858_09050 [Brachymonas sp.]|nr:hypothetical protein [Brachymonas sp.]